MADIFFVFKKCKLTVIFGQKYKKLLVRSFVYGTFESSKHIQKI